MNINSKFKKKPSRLIILLCLFLLAPHGYLKKHANIAIVLKLSIVLQASAFYEPSCA